MLILLHKTIYKYTWLTLSAFPTIPPFDISRPERHYEGSMLSS